MGIYLFTGRPGSGKTYRVVDKLFVDCEKYYVFHNIDRLRSNLFCDGAYIKDFSSIPDFFTLQKQKEITDYIQRQYKRPVLIIVDEAQSNGFKRPDTGILDWLSYHRHLGQDIYLLTQSSNSIHRDYYDRIEYECRAKRGIATNQFIYQYMIEKEAFRTERVSTKKHVFAAYKSFEHAERKKAKSPLLLYALAAAVVTVGMLAYQVIAGVPRSFGGQTKAAKVGSTPAPLVQPVIKPVVVNKSKGAVDKLDSVSYAGAMGRHVKVQAVDGGRLFDLSEIYSNYKMLEADRNQATILYEGKIIIVNRRKITQMDTASLKGDKLPLMVGARE